MDAKEAVFIISVAARLVDMHPSTLRKYERCGLLEPCRLRGRLRLYSPEDIARLRQIKVLVEERGINLAGVELALDLSDRLRELRRMVDQCADSEQLRSQVRELADEMLRLLGASDTGSPASATPGGTGSHP
ncbi:MAG: MerR family transcriptional regulator [Chloroflexi bacterium]|nr:MerR family transcriptional regulator [Chloroflexota bacterium]